MLPFLTARQQLVVSAVLLLLTGFVLVTSASVHIAQLEAGNPFYYSARQGLYLVIGVIAGFIAWRVPLAFLQRYSHLLVIAAALVLVVVLVAGHSVNGSRRWLSFAGFNVQPSEFAKIAVLLFMADIMSRRREEIVGDWRKLFIPLAWSLLVVGLVVPEPDLGTSVVIAAMVATVLFVAGVPWKFFAVIIGAGAAAVGALIVTQPWRVARLTSFMDPWQHQFDSGYQLVQSLIAFGRGEVIGVGLGNSVQKLFYLPEAHTDFVFAVAAEEFGLLGVLGIISLFVLLVGAIVRIAQERSEAGDEFGTFFCFGAAVLFGAQAWINMAVNMGLLPTKGLTLPLVSYGGSSLMVNCALLGMLWQLSPSASGATPRVRPRREVAPA